MSNPFEYKRLFVFSERRMGKASLTMNLRKILDPKRYLIAYVDLSPAERAAEVAQRSCRPSAELERARLNSGFIFLTLFERGFEGRIIACGNRSAGAFHYFSSYPGRRGDFLFPESSEFGSAGLRKVGAHWQAI